MKVKDIRSMTPEEMGSKIKDLERELSVEYSTKSSAGGKSRNYGKIRTIKKTIARMNTFIRAKELGILSIKEKAQPKAKAPKQAKSN